MVAQSGWGQVSDESELTKVIADVVAAHPAEAAAYRSGKVALIGFFIGQVRAAAGNANPGLVKRLLEAALE